LETLTKSPSYEDNLRKMVVAPIFRTISREMFPAIVFCGLCFLLNTLLLSMILMILVRAVRSQSVLVS